jgi:C_GCAxxG_C_C family probable redox protein
MTDPIQLAEDRFAAGFNCSQAVLSAFASQAGISDEVALLVASPFGGGVARQGQVCGALSGALMALGLLRGNKTPEGKDETYQLAQEFFQRFQERHGGSLCRELLGHDISSPEGLQAARENHAFTTVCPALVRETARSLAEFLDQEQGTRRP